jgi:glutamine---fructose-6-phosphate transaminase (isomerizing)
MTAIFTPTSSDLTRNEEKLLENFPDPFLAEICAQPAAIRRAAAGLHQQLPALRRVPPVRNGRHLIVTGMGGSYATCYAPVTTLAAAGIAALMVDSAELLYFRQSILGGSALLVVVSQSGESAEVVRLIEAAHAAPERPFIIAVTNGLDNSLARASNVSLDTRAGHERGPSTMTFAAALIVLAALAGVLAGESADASVAAVVAEAPAVATAIERLTERRAAEAERLRTWLGDRPVLTLLGRGAARAASEMGALTLKEAAHFPAEAMQAAQFRHGPLELAGEDTAAVLIGTEARTRSVDARLAAQLSRAGVAVLFVGCQPGTLDGATTIALGELDRALAPAAAIVPVQLLAWKLAVERGYAPGIYTRASKVTTDE